MSRLLKAAGVAALAAAMFSVTEANAQTVAGKWTAEYPTRVRNTGGTVEAEQMGTAVLVLEVKGDSVFGTWHPQNTPVAVEPRAIKGTFTNGRINFVGAPTEARIRRSGMGGDESETAIKMVTYFEGTVKDGAIDGMMHAESEDQTIKSTPIKWTAKLSK